MTTTSSAGAPEVPPPGSPPVTNVWMYWEDVPGSSCPDYLLLCRQTIEHHLGPAMDLHLLDRSSVRSWLPDLNEEVWERLPAPVQRSDYARTRLIHRHGGLWIDADCIVLRPLGAVTAYLAEHDLVSWGDDLQGRFFNNLFAARPGAPLLAEWIELQDRVLLTNDDWHRLPWAALGSDAFYPMINRARGRYANIPSALVAPVPWYAWRRFFSPFQSPAAVLVPSPVTVMLWNKGMGPVLKGRSADEVLESRMLLSRLLRIALGHSTLEEELDLYTKASRLSDLRFSPRGRSIERRVRSLAGRGAPVADSVSGAP